MKLKDFKNLNKGFVALFTVLIASVILAIAVGIANISLKQIVLSGSATDANKSFYAADTGIECALYNDLRVTPNPFTDLATAPVNCAGNVAIPVQELPAFNFTFSITLADPSGDSCANITIDKTVAGTTTLTSKGTNTPCGTTTARTVERAIQVTY